jgi:hypothetical protein
MSIYYSAFRQSRTNAPAIHATRQMIWIILATNNGRFFRPEPPGVREVRLPIVVPMMVLVVGRNPAEHWKPIEDRDPDIGQQIERLVCPDAHVVVVVRHGRRGD